eukprot:2220750-Amphidinium_carterae.1
MRRIIEEQSCSLAGCGTIDCGMLSPNRAEHVSACAHRHPNQTSLCYKFHTQSGELTSLSPESNYSSPKEDAQTNGSIIHASVCVLVWKRCGTGLRTHCCSRSLNLGVVPQIVGTLD